MRAIVVAVLVFAAAVAHADGKSDAKPHVMAADTAYKLGKFEDALAEYAKAYELFPAPGLLFNLGQCHRNLKHWERAAFFYEGYLREAPATATNRAMVEDLLREVRGQLAAAEQAAEAARKAEEVARQEAQARAALEAARIKAENDAAIAKRDQDERMRREREAEDERQRQQRERERIAEQRRRERNKPVYKKWWFWSAVGGAVAVAGGAYYLSGDTTFVPPSGSLGGLDRR